MREHNLESQILSGFSSKFWFCALSFSLLAVFLTGCATLNIIQLASPEGPPSGEDIFAAYDQIELNESTAADVLAVINIPEYELLSQSKSVIASIGEKKKGYKMWLKMTAFDEDGLTVKRKYLLVEDERPKFLFVEPWAYLKLDCQMALNDEIIDQPYANENARRIEILKETQQIIRGDIDQVTSDNKMISVCGMLINQAIETVLVKLDASPAEAVHLAEPGGLQFSHISYDKGKIRMTRDGNIVTLKIWLGSAVKRKVSFKKQESFEGSKDSN